MRTTPADTFRIDAIPWPTLQMIWDSGHDALGNPIEVMVNDEPQSAPLRCCLKEAAVGEAIGLVAYSPFEKLGPYAEVGPVFIHASPCSGYQTPYQYPADFRHRRQVLRAYDGEERMVYDANRFVDGIQAESTIAEIFANPSVAFVHSRNVLPGCYMFTIHRVSPDEGSRHGPGTTEESRAE